MTGTTNDDDGLRLPEPEEVPREPFRAFWDDGPLRCPFCPDDLGSDDEDLAMVAPRGGRWVDVDLDAPDGRLAHAECARLWHERVQAKGRP